MNKDYVYDFHTHHQLTQKRNKYVGKGLSGLINLGNKCFMNSIIQCLSNTLKLTDYFLSNQHTREDTEQIYKKREEYYIVLSYMNLLINIWDSNQLLKPKSFSENLSKFIKKYFTLQQQDSHECLLYILELLHKALAYEIDVDIKGEVKNNHDALMKKSLQAWQKFYERQYSCIIEIFNGLIYNKISCEKCDFSDDVFEPYNIVSVNIPSVQQKVSLQDCLSTFAGSVEKIENWKCERCTTIGCTKSQSFWSLPNYLIIHLKRFNNGGEKLTTPIDFPIEDLNLTQFVSADKQDPNNYIYSLYAINYHSGDASSGHYWSSCRNLNDNWYLFNDGHVSKIHNTNDLITPDAYILFYYRKFVRTPIQV
jgi:ubiquitin carboxyl-terminal hydrolase 8